MEKSPGEDNLNSELYKYGGVSFHGATGFLSNIYIKEKCWKTGKRVQDR